VAMVVVLFSVTDKEPVLQPAALADLARMGVTSVSLLRDDGTAGLVLEGWAFDPAWAERAARVATGGNGGVRTLKPVMHMAVSAEAPREVT
jgi:hypothetical protein